MKRNEIAKKKNVVLVIKGHKIISGIDTGREAIVVYVTKKEPLSVLAKRDIIPTKIEGIESDVQETGEIRALARTGKYRPMPGGVGGSHPNISAGTINPITIEETKYIISNAHVSSDCNNGQVGDQTWQPGKADGGGPPDTIGHLFKYVPIHFEDDQIKCPIVRAIVNIFRQNNTNKVDCAVSLPIDETDLKDEILDIGTPAGFAEAQINEAIKKSGRTSELTHGTVLDIYGVARVNYGKHGTAIFEDQIITTPIAQPGDSGSLVFNEENKLVGMLFAGSDAFTIVNKITNVMNALGLNR